MLTYDVASCSGIADEPLSYESVLEWAASIKVGLGRSVLGSNMSTPEGNLFESGPAFPFGPESTLASPRAKSRVDAHGTQGTQTSAQTNAQRHKRIENKRIMSKQ